MNKHMTDMMLTEAAALRVGALKLGRYEGKAR
jgi:hypothetical protein